MGYSGVCFLYYTAFWTLGTVLRLGERFPFFFCGLFPTIYLKSNDSTREHYPIRLGSQTWPEGTEVILCALGALKFSWLKVPTDQLEIQNIFFDISNILSSNLESFPRPPIPQPRAQGFI